MDEIRYYPLIDTDASGTDKTHMFFTDDVETVRANHKFYLTEIVSKHYRLSSAEPQDEENFNIHCPHCGKVMTKIATSINKHTLGLYTCKKCRENNNI